MLFADISGSSALYQKFGDATARQMVVACIETMSSVLPRFEGELVKTVGDAILCVFPTADLAALAAGEMQSAVAAARFANHPMAIHVGVHYGRVLVEDGDVFGETVNVAAYLTAVAMRDQILTTEITEQALSPALKSSVRPIFNTVLKGSGRESIVYQVLWRPDRMEITDLNVHSSRVIPGDSGSLIVALGDKRIRLDRWRPNLTVGRSRDCDLVVSDRYASRQHLTIRVLQTRFYLIDHSINGTFVTLQDADEVHLLREEIPLDRSGGMCLGRSAAEQPHELITFQYDRRSMFRL
ncbi:MAG TPA: adenylate/guanylate cyclase domain-containing protein [Burkholderiales bacterium]|nr:adenylate/guanylate cyclase domain-containing protein [Burkholderiales bacterium]